MFPINHFIWLYVIILSRTRFRYNLPSKVAWMSKNFLLETETISEVIKYSFQVHSEDTRAMPEDLKVIYWPKVYLFFLNNLIGSLLAWQHSNCPKKIFLRNLSRHLNVIRLLQNKVAMNKYVEFTFRMSLFSKTHDFKTIKPLIVKYKNYTIS